MDEYNTHPNYWSDNKLKEYIVDRFIATKEKVESKSREEMIAIVVKDEIDSE